MEIQSKPLFALFCALLPILTGCSQIAVPPPVIPAGPSDFSSLDRAPIVRIVDGDTVRIQLNGEEMPVRLIGVDTPETVHPQKPVEEFGKEAALFLESLLKGEEVWLEYDPANKTDRYGRLLAYLYRVPDGLNVNLEIIRQGYGHALLTYPHPYLDEYREMGRRARMLNKGLYAE